MQGWLVGDSCVAGYVWVMIGLSNGSLWVGSIICGYDVQIYLFLSFLLITL